MTDVVIALNQCSARWAEAMLAVVWQSALLVCIVAVALLAWRRPSPAVRCWVWRMLAIKILVMPFWSIAVPQPHWMIASSLPASNDGPADTVVPPQTPLAIETSNLERTVERAVIPTMHSAAKTTWQTWLAAVWLAFVVMQFARLGWQHWQLQRLLLASRPADERLRGLVEECSARLPLSRSPKVRITMADVSPLICGMIQPVLVLPESLLNSAGESQLRQIVLHELAHARRHDLVWCWIPHVTRMMYWFHPVAHWVAFREALERELACDEMAMSRSEATAADYARTLVDAVGRVAMPAALRAAAAAHLNGGVLRL
jgi:beta-lactamase regulating signal transducer with metallopeptidase domain